MGSNSRFFFVLASAGAAIGLGNLWLYPDFSFTLTGFFFIPFLIALLVLGFPLLLLEFSTAQFFDRNIVDLFASIRKRFSGIGWFMALNAFIVMSYYSVILSWHLIYMIVSFGLQWKENAKQYFFSNVLQFRSFEGFSHFPLAVFISLTIVWVFLFFCIRNGFESLRRRYLAVMPALAFLLLFFFSYSLLLEGSLNGINAFLRPSLRGFLDFNLWIGAFSMAAVSLGLSYGVFHSFARKARNFLAGASIIVILFEVLASVMTGFILFAMLGFMGNQNTGIGGLIPAGIGYQFTALAQTLPFLRLPTLMSILFFLFVSIFFILGASSLAYSLTHIFVHKFKTRHFNAAVIVAGFGFLFSMLFVISPGFGIMDIVSHFIYYNILIGLLLEAIAVGWFFDVQKIADFINQSSAVKIGKLWKLMIRYAVPLILLMLLAFRLKSDFKLDYHGYAWQYNLIFGAGIVAVPFVLAFLMPRKILDRK